MRTKLTWLAAGILTLSCGSQAFAAPVVVACRSGQHAVVRSAYVRGQPVTQVECVTGRYRSVAVYRTARHHHRSWAKSALIIGGSAGTGAGIGGIVNGKKGALIGAALGGGVASIVEGERHR